MTATIALISSRPYSMLDVLDIFRRLYPSRTWPALGVDPGRTLVRIDNSIGLGILRSFGREPHTLKASIEAMVGREGSDSPVVAASTLGAKSRRMFGLPEP